jgi:hypothetical protein
VNNSFLHITYHHCGLQQGDKQSLPFHYQCDETVLSLTERRKSILTDNLRYKGIDADEGNNLLGVLVIFEVTMSAQINKLASLGQEPVATAAIRLFTTIIHCNKQTHILRPTCVPSGIHTPV